MKNAVNQLNNDSNTHLKNSSARTVSPLALAAALLITGLSLAAVHSNITPAFPAVVNGSRVVELAPINVTPNAAEMRAALLSPSAGIAAVHASTGTSAAGHSAASLLGEQLAMPYYSFGKKSSVSKD